MDSYKAKLESCGYVVKQEVQYWSLEHSQKGIYQVKAGECEVVCEAWWKEFEEARSKVA